MLPLTNENLPLANFDAFNQAYGEPDQDSCSTCSGCGGFVGYEYQSDPPMGGMVNTFYQCEDCIGQELCPGCLSPLALSFDVSAFDTTHETYVFYANTGWVYSYSYNQVLGAMPNESFECLVCGWQYDRDDDYDYPTLDASGDYDD